MQQNANVKKHYEILADTVIKNLEKRQMEGYYFATAKEAVQKALSLMQSGTSAGFGGSSTLDETGMLQALRNRDDITLIDRDTASTPQEKEDLYHRCFLADSYFMSSNAITADGELINIDGIGNRVAALIYGPKQVIILAGMNKIVPSVEEGIRRVRNTATPPNCIRLDKKTPCAVTGVCQDCLSPDGICNQIVITRRSGQKDRIKVLLIGETLGF